MPIDTEKALERLESYISEIDKLQEMNYKQGTERKRELDTRIQNFIRTAVSNGKEKLRDYRSSVHFYVGILGHEPSEEEEQEDYTSRLRKMRSHLVAYKEELQLMLNSEEKRSKLATIKEETQMAKAEAERRASVLDSKVLGAIIELLDVQRQELKRRTTLEQELINLRKGITDLRSTFDARAQRPREEEHHFPLVTFNVTQAVQNDPMVKRKLPNVGFNIRNWSDSPIRARVKARVFLGSKDLGLVKGSHRGGKYRGYYDGKVLWNLNPHIFFFGNFSVPKICTETDQDLRIEVSVSMIDAEGQRHKLLPVSWTYMRNKNDWLLEPMGEC